MHLSFIGMSNIGKSSWAQRIAAVHGMAHLNCDALIQNRLGAEVPQTGAKGARDLAAWMGQPFEARYAANSQQYMECEAAVLQDILNSLSPDGPVIIDTTGSVIYMPENLLEALRNKTRVIYFEASDQHVAGLYQSFLANPKPLIWGDCFVPHDNETSEMALQLCYPNLMRSRMEKYQTLAHVTVPFEKHRYADRDLVNFLIDYA